MDDIKLILGGPGCGKTTRLLDIIDSEIMSGTHPARIAFVTFTRAAAQEARERAGERFGLDTDKDLPWFRTIHSMAYSVLGMMKDEIIGYRDLREFSDLVGFKITGRNRSEIGLPDGHKGDQMLRICDYAATTMKGLYDAWIELGIAVPWRELEYFHNSYMVYKQDVSKIDFTDMLAVFLEEGRALDVDVAIIDEAQDLTALQWKVVEKAFDNCNRVYIGGDDDQAIYRWAGADVSKFLSISKSPEVLPNSHRLPRSIHSFSQSMAKRIGNRYRKEFRPTNKDGKIERHVSAKFVNIYDGEWFILARNSYLLKSVNDVLKNKGIPFKTRNGSSIPAKTAEAIYLWQKFIKHKDFRCSAKDMRNLFEHMSLPKPQTKETETYRPEDFNIQLNCSWYDALIGINWYEREYYLRCMNYGFNLLSDPKIMMETIHGVKGREADHVMIIPDMSARTYKGLTMRPDDENRVFYVGVTRARETLHIVSPLTDRFYRFPSQDTFAQNLISI